MPVGKVHMLCIAEKQEMPIHAPESGNNLDFRSCSALALSLGPVACMLPIRTQPAARENICFAYDRLGTYIIKMCAFGSSWFNLVMTELPDYFCHIFKLWHPKSWGLEEVGLAVGAVMTLVCAIFSAPSFASQRLYMTQQQQKETFAGNGEIVHDTLLAAAGLVIWP